MAWQLRSRWGKGSEGLLLGERSSFLRVWRGAVFFLGQAEGAERDAVPWILIGEHGRLARNGSACRPKP